MPFERVPVDAQNQFKPVVRVGVAFEEISASTKQHLIDAIWAAPRAAD